MPAIQGTAESSVRRSLALWAHHRRCSDSAIQAVIIRQHIVDGNTDQFGILAQVTLGEDGSAQHFETIVLQRLDLASSRCSSFAMSRIEILLARLAFARRWPARGSTAACCWESSALSTMVVFQALRDCRGRNRLRRVRKIPQQLADILHARIRIVHLFLDLYAEIQGRGIGFVS